jgi:hypothetical protein
MSRLIKNQSLAATMTVFCVWTDRFGSISAGHTASIVAKTMHLTNQKGGKLEGSYLMVKQSRLRVSA